MNMDVVNYIQNRSPSDSDSSIRIHRWDQAQNGTTLRSSLRWKMDVIEMKHSMTPNEAYVAMRPISPVRARLNHERRTAIDESVKFWEDALEYVRSDGYTPETYNLRFGDVPFAWCRRMESIDGVCDECVFFDDEWCGHAPFVNKLQPDTGDKMFKYTPRKMLASNIKAFINVLKSMGDD